MLTPTFSPGDPEEAATVAGSATITPPPTPTPSCYVQNEDPGLGINSAFCICQGSLNYPSSMSNCAYTSLPMQTFNPTSSQVVIISCQICTVIGEISRECTSVPNCVASTTPPPAPSVAPPPLPPMFLTFSIGFQSFPTGCVVSGLGSKLCENSWVIFMNAGDAPCSETFFPGATFFGDSPIYPVNLGPFNGNGLTACSYTKSSATNPGDMTCAGVHGFCSVDHQPVECGGEGNDGVWENQATCTFAQ